VGERAVGAWASGRWTHRQASGVRHASDVRHAGRRGVRHAGVRRAAESAACGVRRAVSDVGVRDVRCQTSGVSGAVSAARCQTRDVGGVRGERCQRCECQACSVRRAVSVAR
jgi:hypothetical protein